MIDWPKEGGGGRRRHLGNVGTITMDQGNRNGLRADSFGTLVERPSALFDPLAMGYSQTAVRPMTMTDMEGALTSGVADRGSHPG